MDDRKRIWFLSILLGIFGIGTAVFLYEYAAFAPQWARMLGNPNVDYKGRVSVGTIVDREGILLSHQANGKVYSQDDAIAKATVHWVGDRQGNIPEHLLHIYRENMLRYRYLHGLYCFGGFGGKMTLTLSARLQAAALEAMEGRKGVVAMYNYQTGELLCALSVPAPDPNGQNVLPADGIYMNRFLQGTYIPGSIFKLVTAAAMLEAFGSQQRLYTCSGNLPLAGGAVTCQRPHGTLNMQDALMVSCNCTFAQIALGLGGEKMEQYVHRFGITDSVSLDGMSSVSGRYDRGLTDAEFAWSSVGQFHDQINPCSFLCFLGAIANGGQGTQPHIVQSVEAGSDLVYQAKTKLGQSILSPKTCDILQRCMAYNVTHNYGAEHFPGMNVCAKSGTAEVGGGNMPNAMFAGFVADREYPLAFLIAVEDGGSGKTVCVPILSRVLKTYKELADSGSI